jgi:hypothetical protein
LVHRSSFIPCIVHVPFLYTCVGRSYRIALHAADHATPSDTTKANTARYRKMVRRPLYSEWIRMLEGQQRPEEVKVVRALAAEEAVELEDEQEEQGCQMGATVDGAGVGHEHQQRAPVVNPAAIAPADSMPGGAGGDTAERAARFDEIASTGEWGRPDATGDRDDATVSGAGSSIIATERARECLGQWFQKYG